MDIRKLVVAEAKRQGMSGYAIARAAGIPIRGVQTFLAGDKDILAERLGKVLDVLGMQLVTTKAKRRKAASDA